MFTFKTVALYSKNWPAPNVKVFIVQLIEHYSANSYAMGSNPVKVPKYFSGNYSNCLNCNYHCDDHNYLYLYLYFRSAHHRHSKELFSLTRTMHRIRKIIRRQRAMK